MSKAEKQKKSAEKDDDEDDNSFLALTQVKKAMLHGAKGKKPSLAKNANRRFLSEKFQSLV